MILPRPSRRAAGYAPFGTYDCGEFGLQDLQRDLAFMLEVVSQVDRGHSAFAELALDRIATLLDSSRL